MTDTLRLVIEGFGLTGWWMPVWVGVTVGVPLLFVACARCGWLGPRLRTVLFFAWLAFSVGTVWTVPMPSWFHAAVVAVGLLVVGRGLWAVTQGRTDAL